MASKRRKSAFNNISTGCLNITVVIHNGIIHISTEPSCHIGRSDIFKVVHISQTSKYSDIILFR